MSVNDVLRGACAFLPHLGRVMDILLFWFF